jgi:hypothetical protein
MLDERFGDDVRIEHPSIIPAMLKAWNQCSRQRGVGYPALPVSLLLWSFFAAAEQAALAQQKSATAAPAAAEVFNAASIGTGSRVIDGRWQFHLGDDLQWAQPGLNDGEWERLPADKSWADAEHPHYSGFAWYRRQIALDPADKNPLSLYLPPLFVTEVYWNGVKVGGIGKMPPYPVWHFNHTPVAVPLPSPPGARSGTLAFREWVPSAAGDDFREVPQLGYAPVIQRMTERWVEHRLRVLAAAIYAVDLIQLCVGLAALVLWLRSSSQWILLCVGTYFISNAIGNVSE